MSWDLDIHLRTPLEEIGIGCDRLLEEGFLVDLIRSYSFENLYCYTLIQMQYIISPPEIIAQVQKNEE